MKVLKRLNAKYKKDSKFRKKAMADSKRRYHEDEKYRELTIERAKVRYRLLSKIRRKKSKH